MMRRWAALADAKMDHVFCIGSRSASGIKESSYVTQIKFIVVFRSGLVSLPCKAELQEVLLVAGH